ncbi:hypothetical protein ABEB36_014004 [Hypothenemus hampei]|uniref:Myb/SANT-like DNA-binding domain-containing protein n=1 Tax=Hypothenemus hampei TaxID=57062 RepID=A0ABD1E377_HYPHA
MANSDKYIRNIWRENEVTTMLQIFNEKNITNLFDGKKNAKKKGITSKTPETIKNKWKALKTAYYKCKKYNNNSGADRTECEFYNILDEILGTRPAVLEGMHAPVDLQKKQGNSAQEVEGIKKNCF